jgi:uncharacterized protein YjlB
MQGSAAGLKLERFEDDGVFPNSRFPLLLYPAAVAPEQATPETMETLFAANGWPPAWRYTVYPFHHYHSNAHEVLGIAIGNARLMLGGPKGREFDVRAGDVIVLPAGVVHRQLSKSGDFLVVGGYPKGNDSRDLLRGEAGERPKADARIAKVPLPATDPVTGASGALLEHWR